MILATYGLLFFSLASTAQGFYAGWNLPSNNPDGSCKTQANWAADLAALTGHFRQEYAAGKTAVKVFTSSGCDTVYNIIGPAVDAGVKVLATVWASETNGFFSLEKSALNAVIKARGCDWLAAISVGSEDLYRREISAVRLYEQIMDVKGMVRQYGGSCATVPITHADTRSEWTRPENRKVIEACDVILSNAFAYWKGVDVSQAQSYIRAGLNLVRGVARGKEVWIGETGWPTAGANFAQSVPSVANLRSVWRMTKCPQNNGPLFGVNHFWFGAFDQPSRTSVVEQNFGVATPDRKLKISLSCP